MRQKQRAANIRKMTRPAPSVEVVIDALVLHGFSAADRYSIGDALIYELGHLFENSEAHVSLTKDVHIPVLNARQIVLPPNVKSISVGTQVAKAMYRGLNNIQRGN